MPCRPMDPAVAKVLLSTPLSETSISVKRPPPAMKGMLVPVPVAAETAVVLPTSCPRAKGLRPFRGMFRISLLLIT